MPGSLGHYRPSLSYLLLDEGAVYDEAAWPEETRNLVAAVFQLEHDQDMQQWAKLIARLGEWLKAPEHTSLRRAFTVWVRRVVLPSRLPGVDPTEISALQDLHEVHDMLAERIKAWPEKWRREGLQEGKECHAACPRRCRPSVEAQLEWTRGQKKATVSLGITM